MSSGGDVEQVMPSSSCLVFPQACFPAWPHLALLPTSGLGSGCVGKAFEVLPFLGAGGAGVDPGSPRPSKGSPLSAQLGLHVWACRVVA